MFQKLAKFGAIGIFNSVCDFIIFNIISAVLKLTVFGLPTVVFAQIVSATILIPVSFCLNRKFTFKSQKRKRDTFIPFLATNLFTGYIVQTTVIYFVVHILGDLFLSNWFIFINNQILLNNFGKCWGAAFGMVINFLSYHFIFRSKQDENLNEELL